MIRTIVYNTLSGMFILGIVYLAIFARDKLVSSIWLLLACAIFCAFIGNINRIRIAEKVKERQ